MNVDDLIKDIEEVEKINNQIIEKQKEIIDTQQKYISDLKEIIEKYILKK